jgi:hypothetical protein
MYIYSFKKSRARLLYGKDTGTRKGTLAEEQDMLRNNGLPST